LDVTGGRLPILSSARLHGGGNDQLRQRELLRILAPPHEAGDLVGLQQMVHGAPQTELVAMLTRAEIARTNANPA
jgi:hypothetical protein